MEQHTGLAGLEARGALLLTVVGGVDGVQLVEAIAVDLRAPDGHPYLVPYVFPHVRRTFSETKKIMSNFRHHSSGNTRDTAGETKLEILLF